MGGDRGLDLMRSRRHTISHASYPREKQRRMVSGALRVHCEAKGNIVLNLAALMPRVVGYVGLVFCLLSHPTFLVRLRWLLGRGTRRGKTPHTSPLSSSRRFCPFTLFSRSPLSSSL